VNEAGKVYIVDDDEAMRDAVGLLMESMDLEYESFASGTEFLESVTADWAGCVVLDVRMPLMSGLEVQKRLKERGIELPIVFITGHADVPSAVQAMREGAVGFTQKPLNDQELVDYINEALYKDRERRSTQAQRAAAEDRLEHLTNREREILDLVLEGRSSKVIAIDLGVSQRTVETHRTNIMRKLGVRSVAELFNVLMGPISDG
jgi:two-component system response regulator FixJ